MNRITTEEFKVVKDEATVEQTLYGLTSAYNQLVDILNNPNKRFFLKANLGWFKDIADRINEITIKVSE